MRKSLLTCLLICIVSAATAQNAVSVDSTYSNNYYLERLKFFSLLHPAKKPVVFLGNSITEAGPWTDLFPGKNVVNRGISGDNSYGVYARIDSVLALKPSKIFLLIGINDLKRGTPPSYIAYNYDRIVARIRTVSPKTSIYLQSVLPVAEKVMSNIYAKINNGIIRTLNDSLQQVATKYHCTYVDLFAEFVGEDGQLPRKLTTDGLHISNAGYLKWAAYLRGRKYL
ncbi:MAG: SGNH/GDSL hydrolase family protein [Chitinophagaceae bacterium]